MAATGSRGVTNPRYGYDKQGNKLPTFVPPPPLPSEKIEGDWFGVVMVVCLAIVMLTFLVLVALHG
jgi:hypothetical protein